MRLWAIGSFISAVAHIVSGVSPVLAIVGAFASIGVATTVCLILWGKP